MAGIVPSDDDLTETSPVKEPGGPPVSEAPADEQVEMPLPYELGSTFQGGLFVLALLAALYAARPHPLLRARCRPRQGLVWRDSCAP
jgi:hypothetical protein